MKGGMIRAALVENSTPPATRKKPTPQRDAFRRLMRAPVDNPYDQRVLRVYTALRELRRQNGATVMARAAELLKEREGAEL